MGHVHEASRVDVVDWRRGLGIGYKSLETSGHSLTGCYQILDVDPVVAKAARKPKKRKRNTLTSVTRGTNNISLLLI